MKINQADKGICEIVRAIADRGLRGQAEDLCAYNQSAARRSRGCSASGGSRTIVYENETPAVNASINGTERGSRTSRGSRQAFFVI